jgi:YesN/AraC family two-component response regulator
MGKILVIDDEKATLSMFRLFLDAYGYTVYTAENGAEGLAIFQKEKPEIVLTDIKMPGIDGLAVLRQIKAIDPNTAVIVITGHGDTALAEQAMALDAVDFINKPIKRQALDAALEKAKKKLDTIKPAG